MLLDEHAGGQRLDGVVVENRNGRLQHDRTSVQLWGDQVGIIDAMDAMDSAGPGASGLERLIEKRLVPRK